MMDYQAAHMIHDNICVFGHSTEEHDKQLIKLIKVAAKNELVFNSNKCRIRQLKISFCGAVFTSRGMKPYPSKD